LIPIQHKRIRWLPIYRLRREENMRLLKLLPAVLGAGLFLAMPAHARNYDCSKAGNANKTVCKNAAAAPAATPAPATPAAAPKAAPAARHYDCSKAGNANKTACKGAAAPAAAPAPAPAPTPAASSSKPSYTPRAAPSSAKPTNTNPAGPNGATAMCNDGSYSHSAHRSGTCSRHGGVKTWY
jgi:hypothetical protein